MALRRSPMDPSPSQRYLIFRSVCWLPGIAGQAWWDWPRGKFVNALGSVEFWSCDCRLPFPLYCDTYVFVYIKVDKQFGLRDHVIPQDIVSLQENVCLCTQIFVYIFTQSRLALDTMGVELGYLPIHPRSTH